MEGMAGPPFFHIVLFFITGNNNNNLDNMNIDGNQINTSSSSKIELIRMKKRPSRLAPRESHLSRREKTRTQKIASPSPPSRAGGRSRRRRARRSPAGLFAIGRTDGQMAGQSVSTGARGSPSHRGHVVGKR
jgi:hypothetical protein